MAGSMGIRGAEPTPLVGSNRNGFGLFDMHGNVWEWCWDGFDAGYYGKSAAVDPRGPDGAAYRVFRGGSWRIEPRFVRAASRSRNAPEVRDYFLGFRAAREQSVR